MNRVLKNIFVTGVVALFAYSCVSPEAPTATNQLYGDWEVDEFYINGQGDNNDIIERLTFERDDTFLLEDLNGFLTVGTFSSDGENLTLTATTAIDSSGNPTTEDRVFNIVFQTSTKMHLLEDLSSGTVGDLEIRYLMNKDGDATYY